jgi:hypothetical protein
MILWIMLGVTAALAVFWCLEVRRLAIRGRKEQDDQREYHARFVAFLRDVRNRRLPPPS